MARHDDNFERRWPAGPKVNALSVLMLGMLGLFVLCVAVLFASNLTYDLLSLRDFIDLLGSIEVLAAIKLSLLSSLATLVLVMIFAIPCGYALSRYRFFGRSIADAMVDLPMVVPPVVIGVSLLLFFSTPVGRGIEEVLDAAGMSLESIIGIVLCQFFLAAPYAIRSSKAAFDEVDRRLEHVALTLGCTQWQAFRRVSLPLARNGLLAGGVMAWARAIGIFGPLLVFVGTARMKVETVPTRIYLELSTGRLNFAIALTIMMLLLAGGALVIVHWLAPGRKWS